MPVVFDAKFGEIKPTELPTGLDTDIATDWYDILIAKRDKILARLQEVIPDESAYLSRIAEVAEAEFSNVLNPNYYKTERALRKFKIKVKKGGSAWLNNVASAFAVGGRFEEGVNAGKNKFITNAMYVWRFTGDKNKVWGCVPKAAFAMKGKAKIIEKIKGTYDSITGSPVSMFKPEHASRVIAALENVIVEGLVMARMGIEAGETVDAILTDYNTIIEAYIRKYDAATGTYTASDFLNTNLDPNNTYVALEYDSVADRLFVHVVQATP